MNPLHPPLPQLEGPHPAADGARAAGSRGKPPSIESAAEAQSGAEHSKSTGLPSCPPRHTSPRVQISLGGEGLIPLEVRFLHNPRQAHGFVGAALSSNVIHFTKVLQGGVRRLSFGTGSCLGGLLAVLESGGAVLSTRSTCQPWRPTAPRARRPSRLQGSNGDSGKWVHDVAIKQDWVQVEGWALPELPPLITDILLSLDDK